MTVPLDIRNSAFGISTGGLFVSSEEYAEAHGGRVAASRFTGRSGRNSIQRLAMKESRTLAAPRDTLLPKLLSGELRVPAAQHPEAK